MNSVVMDDTVDANVAVGYYYSCQNQEDWDYDDVMNYVKSHRLLDDADYVELNC